MSAGAVVLIVVAVLVLLNVSPQHIVTPAEIAGYIGLGLVALGAVGLFVSPRGGSQPPAASDS